MSVTYWEPVVLRVGQAVRVLARPECRYCLDAEYEDGAIGVVVRVDPPDDDDVYGHPYWVAFIPSTLPAEHDRGDSPFAASELEPLT